MISLPSDWNIPGTIGFSHGFGQPEAILCGPTTYNDDNYDFTGSGMELLSLIFFFISQLLVLSYLTFMYTEKHANSVSRPMPVVQAILPQFFARDWV